MAAFSHLAAAVASAGAASVFIQGRRSHSGLLDLAGHSGALWSNDEAGARPPDDLPGMPPGSGPRFGV